MEKNNAKLLDEAKKNKGAFAKLIKKLKSDKILRGEERVGVYQDILCTIGDQTKCLA